MCSGSIKFSGYFDREHVDEVAYAMEFHSVLPENEVISTLHSMLKIKIQNSGIESRYI